jgi:hypothetical protein
MNLKTCRLGAVGLDRNGRLFQASAPASAEERRDLGLDPRRIHVAHHAMVRFEVL